MSGSARSDGLRVAFYAPLKSPRHPVPSGDRLMARLLIAALERAGHRVTLVSELRAFLPDPNDAPALAALEDAAAQERARIARDWAREGAPDAFLCYHPYYKSPDLLGPPLAAAAGIPWLSAEASLSARRDHGIWAATQGTVRAALAGAAMNLCLTRRDRAGLQAALPAARTCHLPPFLELDDLPPPATGTGLVCVAMMRRGDKLDSYRDLAQVLHRLPPGTDWTLTIVGDGPARAEVQALFAGLDPRRLDWQGAVAPEAVGALLSRAALYLWPGCGEAYGLAYLEAQAVGLPVLAWDTAGVPEVVRQGETGILVAPGDHAALAAAVTGLLGDPAQRATMAAAARRAVTERHRIGAAAARLDVILRAAVARRAA
ncbi:glycosyltransferase family 4 protein [Frigidibacter sp. MR17.14]|uniref:glycosyltransferase family 4 protein n=1 Tax=Frigidibacter sp. MR17.14 TaxID=3126509 RepID=UPI00301306CD